MQIVIELNDETYNRVMASPKVYALNGVDFIGIEKAIYYGTPLPKGHGDLKDTEKLKNAFITWSMAVHGNFSDVDIASIIYNSPTIIEADKTEGEG